MPVGGPSAWNLEESTRGVFLPNAHAPEQARQSLPGDLALLRAQKREGRSTPADARASGEILGALSDLGKESELSVSKK